MEMDVSKIRDELATLASAAPNTPDLAAMMCTFPEEAARMIFETIMREAEARAGAPIPARTLRAASETYRQLSLMLAVAAYAAAEEHKP